MYFTTTTYKDCELQCRVVLSYQNKIAQGHYYVILEFFLQMTPATGYISDDYMKIKICNF